MEAHSGTYQTSKMEYFAKIINGYLGQFKLKITEILAFTSAPSVYRCKLYDLMIICYFTF